MPDLIDKLITNFAIYLTRLNLSAVSRKLYLLDARHFMSWVKTQYSLPKPSLFTSSSTYHRYLLHLQQSGTNQSTLKRSLASLKQLGNYISQTYQAPNPVKSLISTSPNSASTLKDNYIKSFTEYLNQSHLSPQTIKSYKSDVEQFLEWLESTYPSTHILRLITKNYLQKYTKYLSNASSSQDSTIIRKTKSITRFITWWSTPPTSSIQSDNNQFSLPTPLNPIPKVPTHNFRPSILSSFLPSLLFFTLSLGFGFFGYRQLSADQLRLTQAAFPDPVTPNRQLSFQGRLETAGGTPVDPSKTMVFKLWDDPDVGEGTQLYTTGNCTIDPDADGIFNTQIGSTCGSGIGSSVFSEHSNVYLEVTVEGEVMSPRQQIATVAYALNSETLQGYPISATVSALRNTVVAMDRYGEIVIGEQSPKLRGVSGTLNISAPALSLTTAAGTSGNIAIAPDGTGQVNVTGNTTTTNFFNISNAQLTTGSLITGTVGNNNTGFKLLDLSSGSSPTSKFSVTDAGLTTVGADLYVSSGISLYNNAVSDDTVEAAKFCTGDGETNCVTDFSSLGSKWTDGGAYLYPTSAEYLGNDTSGGSNKLAGIYLADSAPLVFGTDNDVTFSFNNTQSVLNITGNTTFANTLTSSGTLDVNGDLSIADTDIAFDGASTTFSTSGDFSLSPVGTITLGNNGGTVYINSSDWDIGTTGNMSGIGTISSNGDWTNSQATPTIFLTDSTTSSDDYSINVEANAFNITSATDSRVELEFVGDGSINIGDNLATKTIDIGGVTNSAADTINIATEATAADIIAIGNTNASTALSLAGGTASFIDFPNFDVAATTGNVTLAGNLDANGQVDLGDGGDTITLNGSSVTLSGFNCTTYANGGVLTTNSSGVISCADDDNAGGTWTDGGAYLYPTSGEVLGNSASAGANKIAGIYLADSAPLVFGTDNDVTFSFAGTSLSVNPGTNSINFDSNTLYIDSANNRIGIGTASPSAPLEIAGASSTISNSSGDLTIDSYSGSVVFGTDDDLIPTLGASTANLGSVSAPWDNLYVGSIIYGAAATTSIPDNTVSAYTLAEGANTYLSITTTNNAESFTLNLPTGGGTSLTANLFTSNIGKTINLGTGTAADVINIGTGGTNTDDINIGGLSTSHVDITGAVNFAGGTTYYVDSSGNAKFNDLIAADTANPGLTIGDGTTGYFKLGGSTLSDAAGSLTLDSDSTQTVISDDLQVTGNDLLDSSTTSRITLGATTTLTNTTTTLSGTTTLTASSLATMTTAGTLGISATGVNLGGSATLRGGTAASGTLTLDSTSNATKGDIQFFSSSNALTSAGNLTLAGDLRLNGNDIADSAGTNRIGLGATTTLTNTTTTLSGTTTLTASSLATMTTAGTVSWGGATTLTFTSDNATINGSDAANGNLTLQGTTNATRTTSYVLLQPNGGNVGIGTSTPGQELSVNGDIQLSSSTSKLYDTYVTSGIALGATNETALVGFGASSLVGALNELKNSNKNISHNDYLSWISNYQPVAEGVSPVANPVPHGLFFDNFSDSTKTGSATISGPVQVQDPKTHPLQYTSAPYRIGLTGGQTLNSSTTDNDGQNYLGSNTVNDIYYYDRTRDSSPQVLVELGIDPNWYNGVTLSVATTSATYSQGGTIATKNPNLTTTYNGSLIKATGTDSTPRTIYITIKTPTTFDWTNYQGDAATGVTITPGTAQTLGSTGVSANFSDVSYNVGDVFQIHSWFIEAEGTTRGAKQQFPERSYVVAEGSDSTSFVDVIDADTQKLWMRFVNGNGYYLRYGAGGRYPKTVQMLNGHLYFGTYDGAGNGLLSRVNFDVDSSTYWGVANKFLYDTSISLRNSFGNAIGGTNPEGIVTQDINDIAVAVIPNHPTKEISSSGWGYVLVSSGTSSNYEIVNLPYRYNDAPQITISLFGLTTTAPNLPSDCSTAYATRAVTADRLQSNNTQFYARAMLTSGANEAANYYYCYSWAATGTVSPKQFVAVATGATSADGGTTVINETNGTKADIMVGSQTTDTLWIDKIALAENELYIATSNSTANNTNISPYYGIHGLSSETAIASKRSHPYGVFFAAGAGTPITILGSATGTGQIKSLHVTTNTSSNNVDSNTIYVGTTSGLSQIKEVQGKGTNSANSGNVPDGAEEYTGSVKYYTTNYISEEMIGDIRGMWPLNNSNSSSDFEDVSIKANNLTGTNITAAGDSVSGVRGTATDFDGSTESMTRADDADLDFSTSFSASVWIKTSSSNFQYIFRKSQSGSEDKGLAVNTSGQVYFMLYNTAAALVSNRAVNDGQWHHIVGTYNGITQDIYIDGQLDKSQAATADIGDGTGALYIGQNGSSSQYFTGAIDELTISATALTASQVKNMYQVGYRALQSHSTALSAGSADGNQALAGASNNIAVAIPDFNNQYLYVGSNHTTDGALTKIQLNSDTAIKNYDAGDNDPDGGAQIVDDDVNSLAVGYQLEAVGSAASGIKTIGMDDYATATSGTFYSKTQTLASSTKAAYAWISGVLDSSDGSNSFTVYACNAYATAALCTSNAAWVTGTLIQTDTTASPPENEYSFSFSSAGSYLTLRFDGARGSTKTNTYITRYGATWASSTGGADLAERYRSTEPVYPGDILTIASEAVTGEAAVSRSQTPYDSKVIGIVTTNPGIVMDDNLVDLNYNAASRNSPDRPAVALAGRVPIKVTTKNGEIKAGDPITTSDIPGVGMRATRAGNIVAKALTDFTCAPTSALDGLLPTLPCEGSVLALLNVSWYDPDTTLASTGDFIFTALPATNSATVVQDQQTTVLKLVRLTAAGTQEVVDKIGTFGEIMTARLRAGLTETEQLKTNLISPLASGSAIILQAPVHITSSATSTQTDEEPLLLVEGEIEAATISARTALLQSIVTDNLVAGNITADTITANSIVGLDAKIASLSANIIATSSAALSEQELITITQEIKSRLSALTNSQTKATDIPTPEPLESDNLVAAAPSASDSAILDTLNTPLTLSEITFTTTITETLVASIINAPTAKTLALGNGTLLLDGQGEVVINGNLTVTGGLLASSAAFDSLSLGLPATSSSALSPLGQLLAVYNEKGEQVTTITASGSANFQELATRLITIASGKEATSSSSTTLSQKLESNSTAGVSLLTAGETELEIASPFVTPNSLVYLTPTSNPAGKVLFVKTKLTCEQIDVSCTPSFTVAIDTPTSQDISFNWWIIELAKQASQYD